MRDLLLTLLMILAAYRLTRLVIKDTFPPVLWARDQLAGGWRKLTEAEQKAPTAVPWRNQTQEIDGVMNRYVVRAKWSPDWLAELITCPWCASAYVSACVVGITDLTAPGGVRWPWLTAFAVWAGAAMIASKEWA